MEIKANNNVVLIPINKENAEALFPLFKADLKEISRWFPFGEDYIVDYDLSYVDEKDPPYDETFIIYFQGTPCGRVGLYDYDEDKNELYIYYWVASPYRRKHVAISAINAVAKYLKTLGISRLLFDVKKENISSINLLKQLDVHIAEEDDKCIIYSYSLLPFKTFGVKENEKYYDREGAYVIPIKDNKVCIVKTPKGYFLIGGGMDEGENETDCIARECLEETGCNIVIKEKIASAETYCQHSKLKYFHPIQHYYIGELSAKIKEPLESDHKLEWIDIEETKGKMFTPMQEWAIQTACDYFA